MATSGGVSVRKVLDGLQCLEGLRLTFSLFSAGWATDGETMSVLSGEECPESELSVLVKVSPLPVRLLLDMSIIRFRESFSWLC